MRVLELGSGGYNAALMAELVGPDGEATTVDIDPVITDRANTFLKNAGYDRVRVMQSDGEQGVSEHGPFDRIVVTFGAWDISPAWLDQLAEGGRIVVPLRFAGLTRLIAFERSDRGLLSDSYRLAAFVPAQGDGAFDEELVPITSKVGLRLDRVHSETFDVPALRKAVHSPPIERWSGAAFDMPDELALFLATSAPVVPILHVSQNMVDQGAFALSARRGIPALVEGGSFAYRTKRENEELGGFESGVVAHGPNAEALADRYAELLRHWAANYRYRNAARIEYLPNSTDAGDLSGWQVAKRHGVVSVTWP
jgi:protein-L-isoaspartate(D-aspartate) O-methyltransferase